MIFYYAGVAYERLIQKSDAEKEVKEIKKPFKRDAFIPYLEFGDEHYGTIGSPTLIKDAHGTPLFIGDTVNAYFSGRFTEETSIVYDSALDIDKTFVMGFERNCNKNGVYSGLTIIKNRGYSEISNGTEIGPVKYIKESEQSNNGSQ